jgi:dipeptidyl aminopeptidase/acylaminoacyl peptidase
MSQKVAVQFVVYPRSEHTIMEPALNMDIWKQILSWLQPRL